MARFLLFLVPQSLSLFGSSVLQFAIIWTIVYRYGSGSMLFLATMAGFVPQMISSYLIGPVLDRKPRKALIILSDGISAAGALAVLASVLGGRDTAVLFPLLGIRSLCQGIQAPAYAAVLPQLVPEGRIVRANGLKGLSSAIVMMLAPPAAGFLFSSSYGLISSLFLDIVTAVLAMSVLAAQKIPGIEASSDSLPHDMTALLKGDRALLSMLAFNAVATFLISPGAFMTPLFIKREYDAVPLMLSLSEMSYSAGMIAGGLAAAAFGDRIGRRHGYARFLLIYGVCLLLIGIIHDFPAYMILNLCIGLSTPFYSALLSSAVQERTDENAMGRAMALLSLSTSVSFPLGMVLFGPLADALPIRAVFAISGAAAASLALAGSCHAGDNYPQRDQEQVEGSQKR